MNRNNNNNNNNVYNQPQQKKSKINNETNRIKKLLTELDEKINNMISQTHLRQLRCQLLIKKNLKNKDIFIVN